MSHDVPGTFTILTAGWPPSDGVMSHDVPGTFNDPQRTHILRKCSDLPSLTDDSYSRPETVLSMDFTGHVVFGGAELAPIEGRSVPFSPVVVAYTKSDLIEGHSGIFTDEFSRFLTDYVAFVEGKRMLLRFGARLGLEQCEPTSIRGGARQGGVSTHG